MNQDWVVIFKANGQQQAYIIKGRLETEGIPVIFKGEAIGKVCGLTIDGLGEIKILVPSSLKEKSLQIISRYEG